jgi:hypothetical protein
MRSPNSAVGKGASGQGASLPGNPERAPTGSLTSTVGELELRDHCCSKVLIWSGSGGALGTTIQRRFAQKVTSATVQFC